MSWQYDTKNNKVIQQLIFDLAKRFNVNIFPTLVGNYPIWFWENNCIHGKYGSIANEKVNLEQVIEFISSYKPKKTWTIANHGAEILEHGELKVGCTTIPASIIDEVYVESQKVRKLIP